MPTPIAVNTARITPALCDKPEADRGAEERRRARRRHQRREQAGRRSGRACRRGAPPAPKRDSARGSGTSNTPHRFRQKSTTTMARKTTNAGVLELDAPADQPARRRARRSRRSASADERRARCRPRWRAPPVAIARRSWPACCMMPTSLSESTGSTHGMALRMSPPRTPSSSLPSRSPKRDARRGAGRALRSLALLAGG